MAAIYLAKGSLVEGPYTQERVNELRRTGALDAYHWIWDASGKQWKPLHAAPPPLSGAGETTSKKSDSKGTAPSLQRFSEAVCHNYHVVVPGILRRITETGCEFIAKQKSTTPMFCVQKDVMLNLSDPKEGQTVNVRGTLTMASYSSEQSAWSYWIQWERLPALT